MLLQVSHHPMMPPPSHWRFLHPFGTERLTVSSKNQVQACEHESLQKPTASHWLLPRHLTLAPLLTLIPAPCSPALDLPHQDPRVSQDGGGCTNSKLPEWCQSRTCRCPGASALACLKAPAALQMHSNAHDSCTSLVCFFPPVLPPSSFPETLSRF